MFSWSLVRHNARRVVVCSYRLKPGYQRSLSFKMTSSPAPIALWKASESRKAFRTDSTLYGRSSASYSIGCLQANIAILPSAYADDFSEFCRLNKAPCPVLYSSKPGELDTPLAKGSDIRTDVPKFLVTKRDKSGELTTTEAWELTDYPFDDLVTFYIGCSYTFDGALMDAGIPVPHVINQTHVPMYESNIRCNPVGPFSCDRMIVSMRPVKKVDVEKAVAVTAKFDEVHGAPIHIGNPELIGVKDLYNPEAGDKPAEIADDEVPVFWACGVTTSRAIKTAKPEICMSHSPGSMFICDVKEQDYFKDHPPEHGNEQPKVIPLQDEPFFASVLGEKALDKITKLEKMIQDDPGNRGVKYLYQPGELVKAALRISHGNSIGIVTGFPIKTGDEFCNETDGPLGALTMAKAFKSLGKNVTLILSHYNAELLKGVASDSIDLKILPAGIMFEEFTPDGTKTVEEAAVEFLYPGGDVKEPKFDVLVAIEAVGRTSEGRYKSMRDICLTDFKKTSPVDELFIQAHQKGGIVTIGIGDGGNEIGMGNVKDKVKQHIKNGDRIACEVGANHLLTAGVSNWGGLAVAISLFLLNNCLLHSRYRRHGIGLHPNNNNDKEDILNSFKQEEKVLELLISHGTIDGTKGTISMSVDGFDFGDVHKTKLEQMLAVV